MNPDETEFQRLLEDFRSQNEYVRALEENASNVEKAVGAEPMEPQIIDIPVWTFVP